MYKERTGGKGQGDLNLGKVHNHPSTHSYVGCMNHMSKIWNSNMESVQCTHRTSFCVNYTSIFFKKTTTIILPFTISESQDFVRSTVEMFYFCSLILELPLGRQRLTQQLGPEPFGPRLVSNTAPRVVRYFVCLPDLPHRLLAAFQSQSPKTGRWKLCHVLWPCLGILRAPFPP